MFIKLLSFNRRNWFIIRTKMEWTCNRRIVFFQHLPESDSVNINFQFQEHNRTFNFCRKLSENVDSFLCRARNNLGKDILKKSNRKKKKAAVETDGSKPLPEIKIEILHENVSLSSETTMQELVDQLTVSTSPYSMNILNQMYEIKINMPWVVAIQMPSSILAGYLVYPNKLEVILCQKEAFEFVWLRGRDQKWEEVGRGFSYSVQNEDIDFFLKIKCIPKLKDAGYEFEKTTNCVVQAGPGVCPFEERHLYTQTRCTGNKFRIASYNILADLYSDSDFTSTVLFPYCQKYALNIDYRKQLFIKEIVGYQADILCLQEVDAKIFDLDLQPILRENQMEGFFEEKRDVGEGEAIFFNRTRFQLLHNYKFDIAENMKNLDIFQEIHKKLKRNQQLFDRINQLSTTLMALVLRSLDNPGQVLIVANTHLYFHPDADHIRLMQAGLCVLYLENIILEEVKQHHVKPNDKVSIIFAGDFNSDPGSGIYHLMTKGSIEASYKDWRSKQEETIEDIELSHPFSMASACGCEISNYTQGFKECIDYIFYQTDHISVDKIIPMPTTEQLSANSALPSVVFPSDHVALVADLQFLDGTD